MAPAGPRARPREASPAPVDFSQEDQRGKGAKAQVKSRDGDRVALARCPAGQAGELARRQGRRSGVNRLVDRLRLSDGGTGPIGPGYQTGGQAEGRGRVKIPLNKFSPNFCSGGRRARDGKTTEQISGEHLTP